MQRAQGKDLIVEPVSSAGREGRHRPGRGRPSASVTFASAEAAVKADWPAPETPEAGAEAAAAALGGRPIKTAKAVIDEIRARRDVAALDKILAGLKIEAARRQPVAGRDSP
jgi:hypothetical protein